MSILIGVFTVILIIVSVFLVLVVLAQKAKSDGGIGAAMGGGAAEAAFGADTNNVLTKATINAAIVFFVLSFGLYLAHLYQRNHGAGPGGELPDIPVPAATTTPAATLPEAAPSAPLTGTPEGTAPAATTPTTTAPAETPAAAPAEQPKN